MRSVCAAALLAITSLGVPATAGAQPLPVAAVGSLAAQSGSTLTTVESATTLDELINAVDYGAGDPSILRLYRAFFRRDPDLGGAQFWISQSRQGMTLEEMANFFAGSNEFQTTYGGTTNAEFVEIVYRNVLNREFDQSGFEFWLGGLNDGTFDRGQTVRWITAAQEVIDLYPFLPIRGAGLSVDVRAATKFEFDCNDDEAAVAASGAPVVRSGNTTIYAGTAQVTPVNKDPRLVRFDGGEQTWCRSDLESTGDDGQAHGLLWDGGDVLYGVFTSTGTQGSPSEDFRRFAGSGWLRTYSDASAGGGGAKVAIVARINPATGEPDAATFITARLSNGTVNSLSVTGLDWLDGSLQVDTSSFFSPRSANRQALSCSGGSPFDVTYVFDAGLTDVSSVLSSSCR